MQVAQSTHCTGDKCRLMRPRAPTAYFETVGVKRWATWRQVWEKRIEKGETSAESHVARSTRRVRNKWETSGVQTQNHAAQSIHRQVRYKCRIMRPRAPTAYLETVGDKWETRETSLDSGGPDHLERIWERSAGSCGSKHPQHTAKQVERSGRSGGEKHGTMQPRASIAYLLRGDSETQVGDNCRITRPDHPQHPRRVYWEKSNAQEWWKQNHATLSQE